ncbi:hypothetical protein DFQ28_011736 [Apophysomyces sp. BC1034]|nr:hypothetical protein DFQ29_007463 [Apophysomyces sp. BC1021]KAG0191488.1 hypothetical protein DFQ28_011736 [Apophysomyces sp. BC1034]
MARSLTLELPVSVPENMPHLATVKLWLHLLQAICTILTVAVVAPIMAIEIRYYGGSQAGPNFTAFVSAFTIAIPLCMVYFPWIYARKNKFKKLGKFFLKPRTNLIFDSFDACLWCAAGIAMTVHANNPTHCNFDSDLQNTFGDSYVSAWTNQCNCAKAAAGFAWATCILWVATLICSLIILWNEKQLVRQNLKEHEDNKQTSLEMTEEYTVPATPMQDEEMASTQPQIYNQGQPSENTTHAPMLQDTRYHEYVQSPPPMPAASQGVHYQEHAQPPSQNPIPTPAYAHYHQPQQQQPQHQQPQQQQQQHYHASPNQHVQPMVYQNVQSPDSMRYEVSPEPALSFAPMVMPDPSHYTRQGNF